METNDGDERWRRTMEMNDGDELWRRTMETNDGDERWRRTMILDYTIQYVHCAALSLLQLHQVQCSY